MKALLTSVLTLILLTTIGLADVKQMSFYPGAIPGETNIDISKTDIVLANKALHLQLSLKNGLELVSLKNAYTQTKSEFNIPLFNLNYKVDQVEKNLKSSDFTIKNVSQNVEKGSPKAPVFSKRSSAKVVRLILTSEDINISIKIVACKNSNYVRLLYTFKPNRALHVLDVNFTPGLDPAWKSKGNMRGAPLVKDFSFLSSEHPATTYNQASRSQNLRCDFDLSKGQKWLESMVIGVTPKNQLRRGFLYYIERERAVPFHIFAHYNNWTVTTYVKRPYNEKIVTDTIKNWGEKFIKPYGVKIDTFALDDGWDDYDNSLWQFHKKRFPNNFKPLQPLLKKYNSSIGIWLSPFGGYAHARYAREAYARKIGILKPGQHLSLADKPYYNLFKRQIAKIQTEENVNYLKIDRLGGVKELNAAKEIFEYLRTIRPDVFINLTRDSWPSPFWLRIADSLWRGGQDSPLHNQAPGSNVRKWIAYRDGIVYRNVVKKSQLYPITSLMTHGLIFSKLGPPSRFVKQNMSDWYDQAQSFIGSGINCQELYLDHTLMDAPRWAFLAKLLKWSRANQNLIADTKWVGGDPLKIQTYGWAAWSPSKSILTLRNPSDKEVDFKLNPQAIFNLPTGVKGTFYFSKMWTRDDKLVKFECKSDQTITIKLQPLETVTWEAFIK